ncbi:MAG: undecaprenyl-diphosphate phosphatase [Candidatus Bathyarchaeia archaeon]
MIVEAIILGILQGTLEWLPISSQGNLVLIMVYFLGLEAREALSLSVFLHVGTLFAAVVCFREDVLRVLRALPAYRFSRVDGVNRQITFLLSTTLMTVVVGFPMFLVARGATLLGEVFIALVGVALIITGSLQRSLGRGGRRVFLDLGVRDTLLLGVAQGLSAFPGVSRSGITASALLFMGFGNREALRLSFLMGIPSILVAEVGLSLLGGLHAVNMTALVVGASFSFVSGVLSIHLLLKVAERARFWAFCLLLGVLALLPLFAYL